MAQANNRITYDDDTTVDVTVTMWDRAEAEKYCVARGYGNLNESMLANSLYAAYKAARRAQAHKDFNDFETWAQHVLVIEDLSGQSNAHDAQNF